MMRLSGRAIVAVVVSVAAIPLVGCVDDQDCASRTIDLRRPITRADLDMPADESATTWSCADGFDVTLQIADDEDLEVRARMLGADSYGAAERDSGAPTTIDVHSTWLSIDEAASLANRLAGAFGMDTAQIEEWRTEAQDPPDHTLDTKTGFIRGSTGEISVDLQVIHQSVDDDLNNVHLILYLKR